MFRRTIFLVFAGKIEPRITIYYSCSMMKKGLSTGFPIDVSGET